MFLIKKIIINVCLLLVFLVYSNASAESGHASYYGPGFHGKKTASGERFDVNSLTAAHKTLGFGTYVRVTNLKNGKSVIVKINDRGPFIRGRVIDLSTKAAKVIDMIGSGTALVKIEKINKSNTSNGI